MIRKFKHILYAALTTLFIFASCEEGYDCGIENVAYNKIGFYCVSDDNKESKYEFPDTLSVSLMVNGIDSIVVNHIFNIDNLKLPMSYTNECDTVIFHYAEDHTDTIYVKHENIQFYISMECGTVMYHKLTGIEHTKNYIDSVVIANKNVKFDYDENIKVYFID